MPEDPDYYDTLAIAAGRGWPEFDAMKADVRTLLDRMDSEYVGPEITAVLRRLRAIVGESQ